MALSPVGLGTMGIDDPDAIELAIEMGYRHLDTAQIYENEVVVGEGIAESDVPREKLFVATKVWVDRLAPADVRTSTRESLDRLGLDAVDLLYVHRPRGAYDPATTLPAFEELVREGTVRHVGVSNFAADQVETARNYLSDSTPVFANQVEYHPLFQPREALAHAREHDYYLVAYSPLAGGRVREIPEVVEVAEKHDATPEAVSIAWLTAKDNVVTIPKASSERHLRANRAAASLSLDDDDEAKIDGIDRERELYPD